MKYIRTKDGILLNPAPRNCGSNEFGIYAREEARQADTIEELCDKFIIHNKIETWIRTSWNSTKGTISIYKKVSEDFIQDVYGAIWTDKGLIYVAKMNNKGELELL